MVGDSRDIAGFYRSPLGALTAALLQRELAAIWPHMAGLSVLGIGHAVPCLAPWRMQARCLAVTPAQMVPNLWPDAAHNLCCVAETDALPFADLSIDRILLVHGLEQAGHAQRLLREVWRVLKDDGRLLIVAPNRRGLWAYVETTPFGHGQPYSEGQLARLLTGLSFQVEHQKTALYAPPFEAFAKPALFRLTEKCGSYLAPHFAGLVLAEASKMMAGLVPASGQVAARRVLVVNNL